MITHIFDFRFYSPHFSCGVWLSFLVLCSETARRRSRLLPRLIKMWTRGNRFSLSFGWIVSLTGFKKTFFLNCCLFCSKRNGKIPLVFIMSVKRFKDISDRKTFYRATLLKPPSGDGEAMSGDYIRRLPQTCRFRGAEVRRRTKRRQTSVFLTDCRWVRHLNTTINLFPKDVQINYLLGNFSLSNAKIGAYDGQTQHSLLR